MKKFLISLLMILTVAFFAQVGFTADVPTTFKWEDTNVAGAVTSWDVFSSNSAAGPWVVIKNQLFYDKGAELSYQTTATVIVPDNAQTTVFFKAQTVGVEGLRSGDSNIISYLYDARVTPIAPVIIEIKKQ